MVGITAENGEHAREDDEMSEDGSVDIDGESEDEIEEEEEELEGQPADGDGMDVDMDDAPDSGQYSRISLPCYAMLGVAL